MAKSFSGRPLRSMTAVRPGLSDVDIPNLIRMRFMPAMSANTTLAAMVASLAVIAVVLAATPVDAARGDLPPVRYTLRFPAPHTHYVEVEAVYPAGGARLDLMMPVWTPGSYLVREYARHVEGVLARGPDGRALQTAKTRKNRWQVATAGAQTVTVTYRVYGREMSVRTNWIEQGFAMLNGAATFITMAEPGAKRPHLVTLDLPAAWKTSISGLTVVDHQPHHFRAADFDELVDCPIVAGNPVVHEFEVSGKKHYLVNEGDGAAWDGARAARDAEQIVRTAEQFWGSLPYEKYVFFNMITQATGGLEHRNSTMLMTSRWATRTRKAYLDWLSLAAHEYFHVWNVKRLRPIELGPFDYETEVYSKSLWVAEGLTSYYGSVLLRRAALSSEAELLDEVSTGIRQLQTTPGRLQQPLESASYDAWIKHYRQDENSPNTSVSYYTKGEVVGFLLDAKIRAATNGARSLDDVMRLAFQRYAGARGYTGQDFRQTVRDVAGVDFGDWWTKALETTEELDYTEALTWLGLHFKPADPNRIGKAWLGVTTRNDDGRLVVSQVRRGTPGLDAGINVDDEIIAIDDVRVRAEQLATRLEQYQPGERISLLVARREQLLRLDEVLGREPEDLWRLEVDPGATADQQRHRTAWQEGQGGVAGDR